MISRGLELFGIAVSKLIRRLSIHQVRFVEKGTETLVIKQRFRWSWFPILIGNLVFRFRHPRIEVLSNRKWMEWESAIQLACFDQLVEIRGREITQKRIEGQLLKELLRNSNLASELKLEWLRCAAAELHKFHQLRIEWQGRGVSVSHGDASVSNVIIDSNAKRARWFDFDLRHDLTISEDTRRADDLRAFLFSAYACCNLEPETMLAAIMRGYESPKIWICLFRQISSDSFSRDSFHRSQIERTGAPVRDSYEMKSSVLLVRNLIRCNVRSDASDACRNLDGQNT